MTMLMGLLKVPRYTAVGIMECIWQHTARYCPRGDIGKFQDDQIAALIEWPQKKSAELVSALVKAGWFDTSPTERLLVHGWSEHSDGAADKYLERNGLTYADGSTPRCKKSGNVDTRRDIKQQVSTSQASRARVSYPYPDSDSYPDSDPHVGPSGLFVALLETGKFPGLREVMDVAHLVHGFEERLTAEVIAAVARDARTMPEDTIGRPASWIPAAVLRAVDGPRKKERRGGEDAAEPAVQVYVPLAKRVKGGEE
jgi:hypothetical protein